MWFFHAHAVILCEWEGIAKASGAADSGRQFGEDCVDREGETE